MERSVVGALGARPLYNRERTPGSVGHLAGVDVVAKREKPFVVPAGK